MCWIERVTLTSISTLYSAIVTNDICCLVFHEFSGADVRTGCVGIFEKERESRLKIANNDGWNPDTLKLPTKTWQ